MLKKVSTENKLCVLLGDFNIDLHEVEKNDGANDYYNNMTSYFFSPYILQPTRPTSKTLIDNIFINSLEYKFISSNLTILLSSKKLPLMNLIYMKETLKTLTNKNFVKLLGVNWDTILFGK